MLDHRTTKQSACPGTNAVDDALPPRELVRYVRGGALPSGATLTPVLSAVDTALGGSLKRSLDRKDFRGGLAYARMWKHRALFVETNADGIIVSRFSNDMLVYSQTRTGVTLPLFETSPVQLIWNHNATVDLHGEYWANYVETGPGIRIRLPHALQFSVNLLRGANLINEGNPRRPNYFDLRAGFSYAIVH